MGESALTDESGAIVDDGGVPFGEGTSTDQTSAGSDEGKGGGESGQSSTDAGGEQTGSAATDADDGHEVQTLDELATHLEVEPDWLKTLKVQKKINGEVTDITLGDLLETDQSKDAAIQQLEDAKAIRAEAKKEVQQQRDEAETNLGVTVGLLALAEKLFNADAESADLAKLRETDTEAYLIQKDELATRRAALDDVKAKLKESIQATRATDSTPDPKTVQEHRAKLIDKMPSLADDENRAILGKYLLDVGFTAEEIRANPDYRLYVFAEKARRYDELQAKTDKAKTTVTKIPKVMKPGSTSNATEKKDPKDRADILYG